MQPSIIRTGLALCIVALLLGLIGLVVALPQPATAQEPTRSTITPPPRPTLTPSPGPTEPLPPPTSTPVPPPVPPPVVPEASTLLLLGSALAGLAGYAALQARARPRR